jgi:hypothetical protein
MSNEKGWSEQEETKIAELMREDVLVDDKKTDKHLTRIQAIQKMQRLKQSKKWRPTDV